MAIDVIFNLMNVEGREQEQQISEHNRLKCMEQDWDRILAE
jgi:hypothetical protein